MAKDSRKHARIFHQKYLLAATAMTLAITEEIHADHHFFHALRTAWHGLFVIAIADETTVLSIPS
ncbi:hypothetical protein RRH01S_01_04300 [Rhizobium rhizogenes NBRC 13257]|uniref:Uncharacterized protein n=1 Tax=Rhizobium rhizogenes NBRC 13257 TaxID=1220581 RepID=A0AA87PZC2_RHIRH|nr:hypothetical protein RRH01S_01_04300 [Rhizobium rhizogenes NBRC 13257]